MEAYPHDVERMMQRLYRSLGEMDRRHYAAVEAAKLGHGGMAYIANLLGCDVKTIRQGRSELAEAAAWPTDRQRKKGAAANV